MKVTKENTKRIAQLAHLKLSEEEVDMYTKDLQYMTKYAEQLSELNTADVKPTAYVMGHTKNVLRKDEAKQWLTQEEVLKNAPDQQDGHFKVPSIME